VANPLTRSLASLFRSKADTKSLKRLEREGIRTVGVLDLGQLEEIVGEAIERALAEATANGVSPFRAAQDAQVELLKLLGSEQRLGERQDQLSRQRARLQTSLGALKAELLQSRAKLERQQIDRERAAMSDLRERLDATLREAFERLRSHVMAVAPEAAPALSATEASLRAAMLGLLADALRRGAPAEPVSPQETELELLQRRVKKLTAQLEETQELLERSRSESDAMAQGVPSIYREVQGLSGGEDRFELRRTLMREIFEHNLDLRRTLAAQAPPADPTPTPDRKEEPRGP
jgi:chromosome segregation ATPase